MEDMKLIMLKAFEKTLESIIDKSGLPALTVYGDDAHLYIRSQSKHRPVVALIQTEFAGQDLMGTGPGASAAACAVCKEDTLPWARDGPGSFFSNFINWLRVFGTHWCTVTMRRYAEAETSGGDRMPHVQSAAACPLARPAMKQNMYRVRHHRWKTHQCNSIMKARPLRTSLTVLYGKRLG